MLQAFDHTFTKRGYNLLVCCSAFINLSSSRFSEKVRQRPEPSRQKANEKTCSVSRLSHALSQAPMCHPLLEESHPQESQPFLEALWWEISSNHIVMLGYFINCHSVNFAKVFVKIVTWSSPQSWNLSRPSRTAVATPHICLFWYTTALVEPVSTPKSA